MQEFRQLAQPQLSLRAKAEPARFAFTAVHFINLCSLKMAQFWLDRKTRIDRLRVNSNGLDPHVSGQCAARLLELAEVHPLGLPPGAVLCVHRLRDPLPGKLPVDGSSMRPPAEWEGAVTNTLESLARQAVRPALGAVPALAEAVLFIDPAEVLSCLACDWMRGELSLRWWWQALLKSDDLTRAALQAWREAPEYIPPALQLLAGKGRAVDFCRALDEALAQELVAALVARFGLVQFQFLIQPGLPGSSVRQVKASREFASGYSHGSSERGVSTAKGHPTMPPVNPGRQGNLIEPGSSEGGSRQGSSEFSPGTPSDHGEGPGRTQ